MDVRYNRAQGNSGNIASDIAKGFAVGRRRRSRILWRLRPTKTVESMRGSSDSNCHLYSYKNLESDSLVKALRTYRGQSKKVRVTQQLIKEPLTYKLPRCESTSKVSSFRLLLENTWIRSDHRTRSDAGRGLGTTGIECGLPSPMIHLDGAMMFREIDFNQCNKPAPCFCSFHSES